LRKADSSVHYYFADQIGSANVVTNATGVMPPEQDIEYHPYGEQQVYVDTLGQQYKFTGKEHDTETNDDYFGARYYSSTFGRFLTPDWAATPVAIPYAVLGNPQTLNLYSYVDNNPITGTDPDGHADAQQQCDDACLKERDEAARKEARKKETQEWFEREWANFKAQVDGAFKGAWNAFAEMANEHSEIQTKLHNAATGDNLKGPDPLKLLSTKPNEKSSATVAYYGVMFLPGGTSGLKSEVTQLVGRWGRGSFETVGQSLLYHFFKHGEEVGAHDMLTYLRKADGFAANLKRAKAVPLAEGAVRIEKKGMYIIKDANGRILSYGKVR